MLSPLLGRHTAMEFHDNLLRRICPSCEEEKFRQKPNHLLKYNWEEKEFKEWELFPPAYLQKECRHYAIRRQEQQRKTFIEDENSIERRRSIANNNQENVFYSMTGRMSAGARLGPHKYENPDQQDFTKRAYHIADDIRAQRDKDRIKIKTELSTLENKAVNKPAGKLRPVLHKSYFKYRVKDFRMPRDLRKE